MQPTKGTHHWLHSSQRAETHTCHPEEREKKKAEFISGLIKREETRGFDGLGGSGDAGAADTLPGEAEFNRCRDVLDGKGHVEPLRSNVQDVSGVGGGTPYLALRMQQPAGEWKACSLI